MTANVYDERMKKKMENRQSVTNKVCASSLRLAWMLILYFKVNQVDIRSIGHTTNCTGKFYRADESRAVRETI